MCVVCMFTRVRGGRGERLSHLFDATRRSHPSVRPSTFPPNPAPTKSHTRLEHVEAGLGDGVALHLAHARLRLLHQLQRHAAHAVLVVVVGDGR